MEKLTYMVMIKIVRRSNNNNPNIEGEILDPNLSNRKNGLDWEQNKVTNFNNKNGKPPRNQKRPKP